MKDIEDYKRYLLDGFFCAAFIEHLIDANIAERDLEAMKMHAEILAEIEINNSDMSVMDKQKAIKDFKNRADATLNWLKLRLKLSGRLL